jgi:hypothetical protein
MINVKGFFKIKPYKGTTKWVLRGLILISTVFYSYTLCEVGEPGKPFHIALIGGFVMSTLVNLGWFLGTFEIRSFLRYAVIFYLLVASLGFVIISYSTFFFIVTILLHFWIIICLLLYGKSEELNEIAQYP